MILRSSLEFNVFILLTKKLTLRAKITSSISNIWMLDLDQTRFSDAQFSWFFLFYLVLSLANCYIYIISL